MPETSPVPSPASKRFKPDSASSEDSTTSVVTDPQLQALIGAIKSGQEENRKHFEQLNGDVSSLRDQVVSNDQKYEQRFKMLEQEMAAIKSGDSISVTSALSADRAAGAGASSSAQENSDPFSNPLSKRRVIVVGGLPHELDKEDALSVGKDLFKQCGEENADLLDGVEAPFKLGSLIKFRLKNAASMWKVLKAMKGRKFLYKDGEEEHTLWHGIDKSPDERKLSRKVGKACSLIREHLAKSAAKSIEEVKKWVDADYDKGIVFTKVPGKRIKRIYTLSGSGDLQVVSDFNPDNHMGFEAREELDSINSV